MAADASSNIFDLSSLQQHFDICYKDYPKEILLSEYLHGYNELLHFLQTLNKAFYFVVKDVDDKIKILRGHLNGPNKDSYRTISSMLSFESENKFKGATYNGSRTLLRLHRAMLFIVLIFKKMISEPLSVTITTLAGDAYNDSLAAHHSWAVRKAVGLALYLLPSRESLANDISEMNNCDIERCRVLIEEAIEVLEKVYGSTEDLYTTFDAHSL